MVNLLFIEDERPADQAGDRQDDARPGLRHRRDALGRRGPPARRSTRTRGCEVFGQELNAETYADLPLGHDAQGPGRHQHRLRQQLHRGRPRRAATSTTCSPTRRSAWSGRRSTTSSGTSTRRRASPAASVPGCRGSTTARFLFLQHMISKMKPVEQGGSRLAIVFNGSPLFTGAAGSGESEIRRWIIENDWLEAVVALPDQLFYNTGISTYFWIVTNRKTPERRGKVQLVDARELLRRRCARASARSARRSAPTQIDEITRLYGDFAEGERVKIFPNEAFGFHAHHRRAPAAAAVGGHRRHARRRRGRRKASPSSTTTTRTTLVGALDAAATACSTTDRAAKLVDWRSTGCRAEGQAAGDGGARRARRPRPRRRRSSPTQGQRRAGPRPPRQRERARCPSSRSTFEADADRAARARRATATPSTTTSTAEVLPYVPDAWVDHDKTKIGYEIPLTRHFYVLRAAAAAGGDRRRDQGAGGRDPGAARAR